MRIVACTLLLAACAGEGIVADGIPEPLPTSGDTLGDLTPTAPTAPTAPTSPTAQPLPELLRCHDAPLPAAVATADWNELGSELITLGAPGHSADDVLATDAGELVMRAKFTYGVLSSDLEGEDIELWLDDCSGDYVLVGEATTDSDGRIAPIFAPDVLPGFGSYGLAYRVKGDGSLATGSLRLFPVGTRLLISDIDGTLTTSDSELFADLFSELGSGAYVPEERAYSIETMWTRSDQGYPLVYITGRPYWLTDITRGWLEDLGYPPGTVHLAPSNADVLPTEDSVGDYKIDWLQDLVDQGFVIDGAYGNADTDIYAYAGVGIDPLVTWILGEHGGEGGTVALGDGYEAHWNAIVSEPTVGQPFALP